MGGNFQGIDYYRFLPLWIERFDAGGYSQGDTILCLQKLHDVCDDLNSKIFVADLLLGEYVRGGYGTEARDVLSRFVGPKFATDKQRLFFIEKTFSAQYTTLAVGNYLEPTRWGFDRALSLINETVADLVGLRIVAKEYNSYEIDGTPRLTPQSVKNFLAAKFDARAFYALAWTLQYMAAGVSGRDDLAAIAHTQYQLLHLFAKYSQFERAVWNMSTIIAFQLHRSMNQR